MAAETETAEPLSRETVLGTTDGIEVETEYVKSSCGDYSNWRVHWRPDAVKGSPKCHFFILHGLYEHCSRYDKFASDIALKYNCHVHALDHRGHGRTGKTGDGPGEPSGEHHLFQDFVDDALRMIDDVANGSEGVPLVLFGHSMGGCIALNVAITRPTAWSSVLLSSPLTDIKEDQREYMWHLDTTMFMFSLCCDSTLPVIDEEKICLSKEGQEMYAKDPLIIHRGASFNLIRNLITKEGAAVHRIRSNLDKCTFPLFITHGTADEIVPIDTSRTLIEACASTDKELKELPGQLHEPINESDENRKMMVEAHGGFMEARF